MRIACAAFLLSCALSFAQVEPYENRSLFEILADNPPLLAAVIIIAVLVIIVLYKLFPMRKK